MITDTPHPGWLRYESIINGQDHSALARLTRPALAAASPLYRLAVTARNKLYDRDFIHTRTLPRTTISVGNITAGGTGKTPMVVHLTRRLTQLGAHPAVLLRGYKAGPSGSDEAALIQQELGPAIPVEADPDRRAAAQRVLTLHNEVNVFLLDDAFQHRRVHRHLDLVLIDATRPFGHGRLLPRGLLREPLTNLKRAHALIITRADQITTHALNQLKDNLHHLAAPPIAATAAFTWQAATDHQGNTHPLDHLHPLRLLAVCGIGNPAAFRASLATHAPNTTRVICYRDHHPYTRDEVTTLLQEAAADPTIDALITTTKDWVKWQPHLAHDPPPLPIYRPQSQTIITENQPALDELLTTTIQPPS